MSELTVEVACEVPQTLGTQLTLDHQSQSPLSPDIALYASIAVIRSLGVYAGSLVQVNLNIKAARTEYLVSALPCELMQAVL